LYAGSYLLSYLCRHVITTKENGLEIEPIFPSKDAINADFDYATLPNQFLATLKSDSLDIKKEINYLKSLVEIEFCTIAKKVSNDILKGNSVASEICKRQIKDFFNIFWVALPLQDDNYAENFLDIGKYLASIKNTRNFNQLKEEGRKCSICGDRNVLLYRKNEFEFETKKSHYNIKKNKLFNNDSVIIEFEKHNPVSLKNLQPGEGLCAVCYTKRCINKYFIKKPNFDSSFSSTAEIALFEAIPKLNDKNIVTIQVPI
jgi:CRISPR-associated protein Cmr2